MSEAVFAHFEITRAKNAGQKPNPHGGQFDKWYIGLKNLDGGEGQDDAYWQRNSPSEVTVGDKVYGKLEKGDYGWRFFLKPEPDSSTGRSPEASTGTSGGQNKGSAGGDYMRPRLPEEVAEMRRSHAQEMALRFLAWAGRMGLHPVDALAAVGIDAPEQALGQIKALADFFDADVNQAGQAAFQRAGGASVAVTASSQGASPATTLAADKQPVDDSQQHDEHRIDEALNNQGVTDGDQRHWLIKAWQELPQENRNVALLSLEMGDHDAQVAAVKRLREIAGPMPESFKTDDIPF